MNLKVLYLLLVTISVYYAAHTNAASLLDTGASVLKNVLGQSSSSSPISNPLDQILPLLSNTDWSKVNQSLVKIPDLPSASSLSSDPIVQDGINLARNLTTQALGGASNLLSALNTALANAIRDARPVEALNNLINVIIGISYKVAANTSDVVAAAVIQDGVIIVQSIIKIVTAAILSSLSLG